MYKIQCFLSFLLVFLFVEIYGQSTSNIKLERQEFCSTPNEVELFIKPKNSNRGQQLVDFNVTVPYPLGRNMRVTLKLEKESPIAKNSWIPLITFDVKDGLCVALAKYMGEFVFDMERSVGLPPNVCPIPKGIYHATNLTVDFAKMRLPVMLSGKTRVHVELHHKEEQRMVSCFIYVLSSL